jgi:hypothetical protein
MWPRWNGNGDRLYYARGDDILAVDLTLGAAPTLGTPQLLMSRPPLGVATVGGWAPGFDVSADEQRFLFFRDPQAGASDHQIVIVQNWYAEFEAED